MLPIEVVLVQKVVYVPACGSFHPWYVPFDHRMHHFDEIKLGWPGHVFLCMQVKFGPERPQWEAEGNKSGRPAFH